MECRLAYRRHWATRLTMEKKKWPYRYFITLTYDEEHLHRVPIIDHKTGEVIEISTLLKKDGQDFLKRWRGTKRSTYKPGNVKYFMCGEYGDTTHRAHYHMILFQENPIPDMKFLKLTRDHLNLWTSDLIDEKWGKGICFIGEVSPESRGYVARYVVKKQTGENRKIYETLGIQPEYVVMSNGIGKEYFEDYWKKIYKYDEIIYTGFDGSVKTVKPPKAYDELLFLKDPNLYQDIKDQRRETAIRIRENKEAQTTREDWREIENRRRSEKQKLLKRGDI